MRDDEYIILDNQLRRVGLLSNRVRAGTPFWGDTIDQSIAEDDSAFAWEDLKDTFNTINLAANKKTYDHTITGITVPSNAPDAQNIAPGNHLLYYDSENQKYYVMRMMNIDQSNKETDQSFSFDAQNLCEWKLTRTIPKAFSSDSVNAETAFTNLLAKSGWRLEYNSKSILTLKEEYDGSSSAQAYLQQLAADYDLDVDCYVKLDSAGDVSDQIVEVSDHIGSTKRTRLDYRNDLVGVDRKLVDDALVTKLYVLGNDGATIEDANNGVAFLTDPDANAKYNHDIKGRGSTWLEGTITSETIKNSAGLLAWGKKQLKMYNHPRYNYTVQVRSDISGGIGDDFRVVDFDLTPAMIVDARVIKVSKSKSDPSVHELTLGEYSTITPKKVNVDVDLTQLKKDVSQAHSDAISASKTADSAHTAAENATKNATDAIKKADSATTAAGAAKTAADTAQTTANGAETTATDAKTVASSAQTTAEKAHTVASSAQTTAEAAHKAANDAQTTASGAQSAADTAQTTASGAQTTAEAAHKAASSAQTTAEKAQTVAGSAQTTASNANTTATSAKTAADNAGKAASSAQTTASGAQNTAEAAHKAANDAQTAASGAQTTANTANTTATAAQTAASSAQDTANTANTNATAAQNTANTANTTANAAKIAANNAQSTANTAHDEATKASTEVGNVSKTYFADNVYFQPDQPTGADDGALWFKVNDTAQYLNYHDDSANSGTGSTTKTVTVKVSNDGTKVAASGRFTWSGQHPIKQSPSMTAATRAYTYRGLSATYNGKVIESGILWVYYTSYNGGVSYVPIKDLTSGTRYGTDTNAGSDPAAYHNETQTITVPGSTGNAVNDSQITLKAENVDDVQQYLSDKWSSIPFQKQLVGANISGASIDAPLISLGDGGVVWSSYSITQDPRFYQPIAAQGTVAMAQGELVVSGQTQYYDLDTNSWASYNTAGNAVDGTETNYTTTIINAGGIKNEMQDSSRSNLVGRTYMNGLKIALGNSDGTDVFTVDRNGLSHAVGLTAPDIYAKTRLHAKLIQPDGPNDALKLESGTGYSRVQSQSIYNVTNSHGANVYITAAGSLVRTASASKYKQDIHDMYDVDTLSAALLKAKPKYWFDKPSIENVVSSAKNGKVPSLDDTTAEQPGLIAEDLEELGLSKFLYYGLDGELEGVDYSKLWVLLIPVLSKLRDDVATLKGVKNNDETN
ncbi:phage tail spike protein [Levilactobacillus cerevisiae]|uniref:phage tail spike protein n=1 Tax=Levilactobacillus cerevisiae TaxID=1704076 RepID=UPI00345F1432